MTLTTNRSFCFLFIFFSLYKPAASQETHSLALQITQPIDSMMYLEYHNGKSYVLIDSFRPNAEAASFRYRFPEPKIFRVKNGNYLKVFMLGPGKNDLTWNVAGKAFQVKGDSDVNAIFELFESTIAAKAIAKLVALDKRKSVETIPPDTLQKIYAKLHDSLFMEVKDFIRKHNRAFYSLDLVRHYNNLWTYDDTKEAYAILDESLKIYPTAKTLAEFIAKKRTHFDLSRLRYSQASGKDAPKFYLIDFWGTWCKPCVAAIPKLKALQEKYKGQVQIIGVAYEQQAAVSGFDGFQKKYKLTWPQVVLTQGKAEDDLLVNDYSVLGFPTYFLVAPDGKIIFSGAAGRSLDEIKEYLSKQFE